MLPSTKDDVLLVHEVSKRLLDLNSLHQRLKGTELRIPEDLTKEMQLFDRLSLRYRKGDLRHTEGEKASVRAIAQWSVLINCSLRNQPPKVLTWTD